MAPATPATGIKSAAKTSSSALTGKTANASTAKAGKTDAVSLLKADHRKVEQLFAQFEQAGENEQKRTLVEQICKELIIHTRLEEEIFYPACREKHSEDDQLDEAQVEHDGAKVLIADLLECEPGGQYYDAKVKTLSEYIKHHVGEEEEARSGIFAKAQKAGVDMADLGQKIQARKTELMEQGEAISENPPQPRSFTLNPSGRENSMARNSNDRDRDERGRFTDDDNNHNGGRGRGGYGYPSRGQDRERDDQGRFMSDDDRGYSSRRRDDDDDYRSSGRSSGGRGHGGWFGDSEGHSQASREGWEDRGASRSSRSSYDDDRGYSSRGGQGNYRERDDQGRFMSDDDDRGYSRSSRGSQGGRGQSHSGHGGWYGDSEGHSQAAREGWEDRGSSRSRDDDDDRGSRSSHGGRSSGRGHSGHGGWFGDSEGHSQASREGWRNR